MTATTRPGKHNTWTGNHGETSSPMGLCSKDPDDAAFETSTVYGWDPSYPWSTAFDIPTDYDWAAAYATIRYGCAAPLTPQDSSEWYPSGAPTTIETSAKNDEGASRG